MTLKRTFSNLTSITCSLLCLLTLCLTTAIAQRGGLGAKGGTTRPERIERPSPTPTPTPTPAMTPLPNDNRVMATEAQTEPTPEATPEEKKLGTDPGTYFFLYGVSAFARPRHAEGTSQKIAGGFAFNVYVTRRIFVEIDNDNFVSLKPDMEARRTSFGDTVLIVGGDPVLENSEGKRPNFSVVYGIKIPTASSSKGTGSGEVDHLLFATVNKNLLGRWNRSYVELNFTEYFAGRGNGAGFAKSSSLAGIYRHWLNDKKSARLHFEVGGTFATKESNAEMYTFDYLEYFVNNRVSMRVGGRFGLTPNVPRAGLYLAITLNGKLK
jgi:hypothetical protein